MSSTHTYNGTELESYAAADLEAAIAGAGYTFESVRVDGDEVGSANDCATIQVAENSVDKATLLTAINDALPLANLSASALSVSCVGDGVATASVTISDSRGAAAEGKTCKLRLIGQPGLVKLTPSAVFDAVGDAVFTLGPTPAADMCSPSFEVEFYVDTEPQVKPVRVSCHFTGP